MAGLISVDEDSGDARIVSAWPPTWCAYAIASDAVRTRERRAKERRSSSALSQQAAMAHERGTGMHQAEQEQTLLDYTLRTAPLRVVYFSVAASLSPPLSPLVCPPWPPRLLPS